MLLLLLLRVCFLPPAASAPLPPAVTPATAAATTLTPLAPWALLLRLLVVGLGVAALCLVACCQLPHLLLQVRHHTLLLRAGSTPMAATHGGPALTILLLLRSCCFRAQLLGNGLHIHTHMQQLAVGV